MTSTPTISARRIVVFMPNWLGDAVMATPMLRALRQVYPDAHIAALHIPLVGAVLRGLPFVDQICEYDKKRPAPAIRWLREQHFDLAILLPNSFRSAWMAFRAGIPRRLGYAREWRSLFLTDSAMPILRTPAQKRDDLAKTQALRAAGAKRPPRIGSAYQPVPTIDYYLTLAAHLGASPDLLSNRRMELGITEADQQEASQAFASLGLEIPSLPPVSPSLRSEELLTAAIENRKEGGEKIENPLVIFVPGANFGSSKCWPPERFARLADYLMDRQGDFRATVLIATSPAEKPIAQAIIEASYLAPKGRLLALAHAHEGRGVSLGALKEIIRRSSLMVCNDTGPRHFAAAMDIPVVTLFGPTDPRWADIFYAQERTVSVPAPCAPCQLKTCPIDHRCMNDLTLDLVLAQVNELWPHQDFDPRLDEPLDLLPPLS